MNQLINSSSAAFPDHLLPAFHAPVAGPLRIDAGVDFDRVAEDLRVAWEFARAKQLSVLSANVDRNGAYLVVVPSPRIYTLFGDECARIQRRVDAGLAIEFWMGCIEHIRVFWREVKCTH